MGKKTVFWGAGLIGRQAMEHLQFDMEYEIVFGDNDYEKQDALYCGKKVIGMPQVVEMYRQEMLDMILLTIGCWEEILIQCLDNGIPKEIIKVFDASRNRISEPYDLYGKKVYSQDGEELFLRETFEGKKQGTYVDIGANHPYRFSNTWWAYQKGWRGINVEPDIKNYKLLKALRSEDANINCGVSDKEGEMVYYEFQESALNTFCKEEAERLGNYISERKVSVCKMSTILEQYGISEIDFMDIDVEGMELQVLSSINWDNVSVKYILLEQRGLNLAEVLQSEEYAFLAQQGYEAICKFDRTVVYERK